MFPKQVECDQCGQMATVIDCQPIFEDPGRTGSAEVAQLTMEVSCKIDCNECGNRIQILRIEIA